VTHAILILMRDSGVNGTQAHVIFALKVCTGTAVT